MKFFILGDSWGVGEWKKIGNTLPFGIKSVPNTGLDYYLKINGHNVKNISAGSAGNFGQLRHAYWTLKENHDYDYIIWFHTETYRDIQEIIINDPAEASIYFPNFTFELDLIKSLRYVNRQNYKYAQHIFDEFNIPFIVIGGHGPVDLVISEFSFAMHTISWLKELLNLSFDPPSTNLVGWPNVIKIANYYNINEKDFIIANFEELEKSEIALNLAENSINFPDNGHPSRQCFEQLANRIIEMTSHARQS
jgi:hypothetical protein